MDWEEKVRSSALGRLRAEEAERIIEEEKARLRKEERDASSEK